MAHVQRQTSSFRHVELYCRLDSDSDALTRDEDKRDHAKEHGNEELGFEYIGRL